jgi:thiol:disulfide interchange protein
MEESVPPGLRIWFVVHFVADMLFGIPLLFFPRWLLPLLGWTTYDPLTSRLVGAALMGIGLESLFGRNSAKETFHAMLNLKIIWASSAIFAIAAALFDGAPLIAWAFLGIFVLFWFVWVYYRVKIK